MQKVNCDHWNEGVCALNYFGGRPSYGTCVGHCPVYLKVNGKTFNHQTHLTEHEPRKPFDPVLHRRKIKITHKGLGDTVKWAIEKFSFGLIKQKKGCGCAKRQSWLNRHFPYQLPKWLRRISK